MYSFVASRTKYRQSFLSSLSHFGTRSFCSDLRKRQTLAGLGFLIPLVSYCKAQKRKRSSEIIINTKRARNPIRGNSSSSSNKSLQSYSFPSSCKEKTNYKPHKPTRHTKKNSQAENNASLFAIPFHFCCKTYTKIYLDAFYFLTGHWNRYTQWKQRYFFFGFVFNGFEIEKKTECDVDHTRTRKTLCFVSKSCRRYKIDRQSTLFAYSRTSRAESGF